MRTTIERAAELGQPCECGNQSDARDGTACNGASNPVSQLRNAYDEKIAVPEPRPGSDDENQPGFEKVGSEQQARDKRDNQPPDIPDNRSVRAATSRYSAPSA